MRMFLLFYITCDLYTRLSLLQRDLKNYPINNVENHNESQGAEKSKNIQFLAHFINIPIIIMSVRFDVTGIKASNLNSFA